MNERCLKNARGRKLAAVIMNQNQQRLVNHEIKLGETNGKKNKYYLIKKYKENKYLYLDIDNNIKFIEPFIKLKSTGLSNQDNFDNRFLWVINNKRLENEYRKRNIEPINT